MLPGWHQVKEERLCDAPNQLTGACTGITEVWPWPRSELLKHAVKHESYVTISIKEPLPN